MKITKIQPAVRTVGRYNVYVDGKYSLSLDEVQLISEKIKVGLEIDENQLTILQNESQFGKNYTRALELISRRPRSLREMSDYARRKKWEEDMKEKVLTRLTEKGYIDDRKFAQFWLNSRVGSKKPISKRKLTAELLQKGVEKNIIDSVLQHYSEEEEYSALLLLVEKKKNKYSDTKKFTAFLVSKGYGFDMVKKALAEKGITL